MKLCMKKMLLFVVVVCVLFTGCVAFGSNWNGVTGDDWTIQGNWGNGPYPSPTGAAWIIKLGTYPVPVVRSNVQTSSVSIGFWSWDGQLDIESAGTLTVSTSTVIGHNDGGTGRTGLLNINGGIYNSDSMFVGQGYTGYLNLNGGQLNVTGGMIVGDGKTGRVDILAGVATVGGTLYMNNAGGTGLINIEAGTLILHNNPQSFIDNGQIVAYNGSLALVNTDNGDGSWTVAVPEPMTMLMLGIGSLFLARRKKA